MNLTSSGGWKFKKKKKKLPQNNTAQMVACAVVTSSLHLSVMKLTLPFLWTYADHKPGTQTRNIVFASLPTNLVHNFFFPPCLHDWAPTRLTCHSVGVTVICPRRASILLDWMELIVQHIFTLHVQWNALRLINTNLLLEVMRTNVFYPGLFLACQCKATYGLLKRCQLQQRHCVLSSHIS